MIFEPSGDQLGAASTALLSVSFLGAVPSALITKISGSPSWVERKAIFIPSGLYTGSVFTLCCCWAMRLGKHPLSVAAPATIISAATTRRIVWILICGRTLFLPFGSAGFAPERLDSTARIYTSHSSSKLRDGQMRNEYGQPVEGLPATVPEQSSSLKKSR